MNVTRAALAGSLESSDVLVSLGPRDGDSLEFQIESIVIKQFGERIRRIAEEVCTAAGLTGAIVRIQDRGALECTMRARLETAIARATAPQEPA